MGLKSKRCPVLKVPHFLLSNVQSCARIRGRQPFITWLRNRNCVQLSILDSARRTSHVPLPAISSFGGLRTPAPEYAAPSSWGRHPKTFTLTDSCAAANSISNRQFF